MENKRNKGSRYEELAAAYLISQGLIVLDTNFRFRRGEIDLIAREGDTLCFVEVKGRRDDRFGDPAEAVDSRKQATIRLTARWYLLKKKLPEETSCRFDVISICGSEIRYIRDAY